MSKAQEITPADRTPSDDIPEGWRWTTLGQFIRIKHGYAFSGEFITSEPTPNVLVTPGNFHIGGGFKASKFKYFAGEVPEAYRLRAGDIVVTMTDLSKDGDTLGYGARIPASSEKAFLHNQRIGLVEFKGDAVDPDFLYWVLRTREYQAFVISAATGTSVRHTSPSTIQRYEFVLPSRLEEQRAIAAALDCLDCKIGLLHQQNQTLEAMAEALFRQWFSDEAGAQWAEGKVEDLFELQRGYDLPTQDRVAGSYPIVASSGLAGTHQEPKVKGPGVATGRSGLIGRVFLMHQDFWPLNTTLYIKTFKLATPAFAYAYLKTMDLDAFNAGSAVPTLNRNHVHAHATRLPPGALIEQFEAAVMPWFIKIHHNSVQTRSLEALRDALLPKLISGEVRVAY